MDRFCIRKIRLHSLPPAPAHEANAGLRELYSSDVKVLHLIKQKNGVTMPTKNPRINITFEATTAGLLTNLAKQEHKSVASLAKELILEALERREDMALSAVAKARDVEGVKKVDHDDAWK